MCLAIPGEVLEINGKKATVSIMGAKSEASIELLEDVKPGDYVIVHAGCAIAIVDNKEARDTIELFQELGEMMHGKG